MSATEAAAGSTAVRPFEVASSDRDLVDLGNRINATRWPERETISDDSQGVPRTLPDVSRQRIGVGLPASR